MIVKPTPGRKLILRSLERRKTHGVHCGHPPSFWARCQNAGTASWVYIENGNGGQLATVFL